MSDNTKDGLAFWGMTVLIGIPAVAYSFEHFGAGFGCVIFVPVVVLGRWLIDRTDELRRFRHDAEDREEQLRDDAKKP